MCNFFYVLLPDNGSSELFNQLRGFYAFLSGALNWEEMAFLSLSFSLALSWCVLIEVGNFRVFGELGE